MGMQRPRGLEGTPGKSNPDIGDYYRRKFDRRNKLALKARAFTKEALDTIVAIMRDVANEPTVRLKAATELLDRGWGKAPQHVDLGIEGNQKTVREMTDAELVAIIDAGKKRREEEAKVAEQVEH